MLVALGEPAAGLLETERSWSVTVVLVLLTGGDAFADVLAFDPHFEFGEHAEQLEQCGLIRVLVVGPEGWALADDVKLGAGIADTVDGPGEVADGAGDA